MAIALEWDAQTDTKKGIQPATMPLMTLASTAIDQVALDRTTIKRTVLSYLPTDTALFYAHPDQRTLLQQQRKTFRPLTRWLQEQYGLELLSSEGLTGKIQHPEETIKRLNDMIDHLVSTSAHIH